MNKFQHRSKNGNYPEILEKRLCLSAVTFESHEVSNATNGATSVYAADLDGDGDTDVLSASAGDNRIAWHENNGATGEFVERVISSNAIGATSVFAADQNNDSELDVLTAAAGNDSIIWYENSSAEIAVGINFTFESHEIPNAGAGSTSVHAADLDGDGDIDIVTASSVRCRLE